MVTPTPEICTADPDGKGLVTDVCLKQKSNYVGITKQLKDPYDIYVKEKAVLGRAHFEAFNELGIPLTQRAGSIAVPERLSLMRRRTGFT